jgi:hypothetical protein
MPWDDGPAAAESDAGSGGTGWRSNVQEEGS